MKLLKEENNMTKENQAKIDAINEKIEFIQKKISDTYDNSERAMLDCEIKKCMKEIDAIKLSEKEKPEAILRIDDPTFLDRKQRPAIGPKGGIKKLGSGGFSFTI